MKEKVIFPLLASMLLVSAASAQTPDAPPMMRLSSDQMAAVKACAAAQGVDLPGPPPGRGPGGSGPMGGDHEMASPPDGKAPPAGGPGDGNGRPPRFNDEQRKILDACFAANGLTPPAPPQPPR